MNLKLLKILRCPVCLGKLSLENSQSDESGEVIKGLLTCVECKKKYPIIEGVPVMGIGLKNDMARIRKSFSNEWKIHDYYKTKTWRLETSERKKMFLDQMGLDSSAKFKGKILLDAGCGNGELTAAISEFGLDSVGIDLSDSIFNAYKNNKKKNTTFFVQGDLMNPPFAEGTFDYGYSDGVIHHTTSSKYTFFKLANLIKKKGRLWVWVYHKKENIPRNRLLMDAEDVVQYTLARLPNFFQDIIIQTMALPLATVLQGIGVLKTDDNWKEKEILIRDAYTHIYNFRHSPEEVKGWFIGNGFKDINGSDNRPLSGFGTYGTR